MSPFDMFFPALKEVWVFIPIVIVLYILKVVCTTPWFKGVLGEYIINLMFKRLPEEYHLIKNVTLQTEDGTTQIDHIIVSEYGIFVVETKNYRGWIYGSENKKQWTQKIFKKSFKFQNPLHQNYKHLKTLESLLSINSNCLFSVIVFIGDSEFKTEMPANVTFASGCLTYIKSQKEKLISHEETLEVIEAIVGGALDKGFATNKAHKEHVKDIVKRKKEVKETKLIDQDFKDKQRVNKSNEKPVDIILKNELRFKTLDVKSETESNDIKKCPKCMSNMVLRKTKRGVNAGSQFWGCSEYPRCRKVIKIPKELDMLKKDLKKPLPN